MKCTRLLSTPDWNFKHVFLPVFGFQTVVTAGCVNGPALIVAATPLSSSMPESDSAESMTAVWNISWLTAMSPLTSKSAEVEDFDGCSEFWLRRNLILFDPFDRIFLIELQKKKPGWLWCVRFMLKIDNCSSWLIIRQFNLHSKLKHLFTLYVFRFVSETEISLEMTRKDSEIILLNIDIDNVFGPNWLLMIGLSTKSESPITAQRARCRKKTTHSPPRHI